MLLIVPATRNNLLTWLAGLPFDHALEHGHTASDASSSPAVAEIDGTEVVTENHSWQYERRSADVSITSEPLEPSGLVSHAESSIDQCTATCEATEVR